MEQFDLCKFSDIEDSDLGDRTCRWQSKNVGDIFDQYSSSTSDVTNTTAAFGFFYYHIHFIFIEQELVPFLTINVLCGRHYYCYGNFEKLLLKICSSISYMLTAIVTCQFIHWAHIISHQVHKNISLKPPYGPENILSHFVFCRLTLHTECP